MYNVGFTMKYHSDDERKNLLTSLHELHFPVKVRNILYAPYHRQDSTYHGRCYTSRGALAGMRNWSK